jgi:hypothetical protein
MHSLQWIVHDSSEHEAVQGNKRHEWVRVWGKYWILHCTSVSYYHRQCTANLQNIPECHSNLSNVKVANHQWFGISVDLTLSLHQWLNCLRFLFARCGKQIHVKNDMHNLHHLAITYAKHKLQHDLLLYSIPDIEYRAVGNVILVANIINHHH